MPGEWIPGESIVDSAMTTANDVWESVRGLVQPKRDVSGYSQLPVEMNENV